MLAAFRYRSKRKLPILLLVFLLCVQSLGFASHGSMMNAAAPEKTVAEIMPPCHDMPDMEMANATQQEHAKAVMPCCDDGQCADAHCMMPAGIYFPEAVSNYFLAHDADISISDSRGIASIKPSPPTRPPIA